MTRVFTPLADFPVPPPATPAAPDAPAVPGFQGQLPHRVAQVILPKVLAPHEKQILAQAGWREGDPVPADLAQRLNPAQVEQILASVAPQNLEPPVPLDTPPMAIPPEQDYVQLPPAHRAEVEAALSQAKAVWAQQQAAPLPTLPQLQIQEEILVDDVAPAAAPAAPAAAPAQPSTTQPAEPPTANETGQGAVLAITNCPHCHWDLSVQDIPDPDPETRQWYLQAVLGLVPFEKVYSLLGGRLEVTFRELQFAEVDAIYRQMTDDVKAGQVGTEVDYMERNNRYRVATQLSRIWLGERGHEIPRLGTGNWTLPSLEASVAQLLPNASLYRVVRLALVEFNRTVAKLEACAARENFWQAASPT